MPLYDTFQMPVLDKNAPPSKPLLVRGVTKVSMEETLKTNSTSDLIKFACSAVLDKAIRTAIVDNRDQIPMDVTSRQDYMDNVMIYEVSMTMVRPSHLAYLEDVERIVKREAEAYVKKELEAMTKQVALIKAEQAEQLKDFAQRHGEMHKALENTAALLNNEKYNNKRLAAALAIAQQPWWQKVIDWIQTYI